MVPTRRFVMVSLLTLSMLLVIALFVSFPNPATVVANPAQATTAPTAAGTAPANQVTTFKCQPVQISVSPRRIHVKCATGIGKVVYFAASTQDQDTANRYLTLLTTAMTARKQLVIDVVMADLSGEAFGCANADCRVIGGLALEQ